jgi:hypothetical protein
MAYGTVNADVISTSVANTSLGAGNATRFKNRIINGDMRIDQRNAGASITPTNGTYSLDRWRCAASQTSKYTVQQNAGSITPPSGFINYLGVTSSSAYTVISSDVFNILEYIEGLNIADLDWGTANAKTVTLSFQVYSSLTGTFGGALRNSATNRSYPFNYTISSANTWTQISITIAGDTTGTWLTTNGIGISVAFSLGTGTALSGTAGVWAAADYRSATGATSVVGTSGATFYITGVQLEVGTSATGFEYVDYGTQLLMCQRYFQRKSAKGQPGPANQAISAMSLGLPVQLRTDPSISYFDQSGNASRITTQASGANQTISSVPVTYGVDLSTLWFDFSTGSSIGFWWAGTFWLSAEL